ncbi:hypothetical protein RND81_04G035700 [Saponaria officinalis]|uniref:Uncharacterized protein n=1 Tax=Saponaria officinalis TaxID=3572 RepID=A0AAW1LIZ0_SAPOF
MNSINRATGWMQEKQKQYALLQKQSKEMGVKRLQALKWHRTMWKHLTKWQRSFTNHFREGNVYIYLQADYIFLLLVEDLAVYCFGRFYLVRLLVVHSSFTVSKKLSHLCIPLFVVTFTKTYIFA